ncbi:MAG: GTP-binding protein [Pseudomonadota bacterium]
MITGIPVNIICGPLGVGKTTLINHLLTQRPADERWAVLINEYGLVGLDAAIMDTGDEPSSHVAIKEVAGGCICCSAGPVFEVTLIQLLRRKPDRLLIEPTGLATLSGILDTLSKEGIRDAVDLRSIICLLNPATLERDLTRNEVRDQVEASDVLLASRSDLASGTERERFQNWAAGLFPARGHIGEIEHGRLPAAYLDLGHHDGKASEHGYHHHEHTIDHGAQRAAVDHAPADVGADTPILRHVHRSAQTTTIGWVCWAGLTFDSDRVDQWLEALADAHGVRRLKAVLKTSRGWRAFNIADDVKQTRPSAYRRDSRIELIAEGDAPPDPTALEAALRGCLRDE